MRKRLTSYAFDASAKTITAGEFSDVTLPGIQLIVNVTDQIVIYNFADTTKGGTLSTDTLTLEYDTTSMSDTDELMILVEDGSATQPVSGSVTANVGTTNGLALDATLTDGTQQAKITDGTNIANVLKNDGTAAGQNALMAAPAYMTVPFTTTTAQAVGTTDVSNYRWVGLQITSQGGSSTVTYQGSNDNSTWTSINLFAGNGGTSTSTASTASTGLFGGPIQFKYFRLNVTGIVSGTTAGTLFFSTLASQPIGGGTMAAQSGPWTSRIVGNGGATVDSVVGAGTAPTNQVVTGAVYNSTEISPTTGQAFAVQADSKGRIRHVLMDAAGNTRGANVNASNQLSVAVDNNPVLGAGTNAIGKLAANSGVDIGDVDVTSIPGIVGPVADDATTPGAPVMIGGTAKESDGTDPGSVSAEDDVTRVITDRNRRLYVNTTHPNLWTANDNQSSAQTNTVLKAAPGANLSLYVTDVTISNGATAGDVRLVEDPAGTPVIKVPKIYTAVNGGAVMQFETPIRLTANKALGYTSTTVTTHSVLVNGYIAP